MYHAERNKEDDSNASAAYSAISAIVLSKDSN